MSLMTATRKDNMTSTKESCSADDAVSLLKQSSIVDAPGTQRGPCKRKCGHMDCQWSRRIAISICDICRKPIGFGKWYIRKEDGSGRCHLRCYSNKKGINTDELL